MKVTVGLDQAQKVITVTLVSGSVSTDTSFDLKFYEEQDEAAVTTYAFTAGQISAFKADGVVLLLTDDVFTTYPDDIYYYCKLVGDVTTSDWTSVSFTLGIRSDVYTKTALVNVYSPDYSISTLLHTAKMLLDEIEQIQYLDFSSQKKIDFDVRYAQLEEILSL